MPAGDPFCEVHGWAPCRCRELRVQALAPVAWELARMERLLEEGEETPMKAITDHHDGHGLTESIELQAVDEPGPGGAHHRYTASIDGLRHVLDVQFQRGPRHEPDSTPGVVEGVLLAIVVDRMRDFQAGPYGCRENALVLTKCEEALHWLRHRADGRAKRGVLGTNQK